MWPWGDLTPYYPDRDAPMTCRQTFAYVLEREELVYPLADGTTPPPLEPPRWRGAGIGKDHGGDNGAQDWQVTCVGHLVREKQGAAHNRLTWWGGGGFVSARAAKEVVA